MRMIPSSPGPETRSRAERRVFDLLKNTTLSSDASCFHSTKLSEHDYKIAGEIDFIVLTPRGILVLEVKGGGVTRNENGIWTYRDRFGREHRSSEGPFEQARSAMFALRDRLRREMTPASLAPLPFGFGVLFPDCAFDARSVEWAPETILDGHAVRGRSDLRMFLQNLLAYWEEKHRGPTGPNPLILRRVAELLRPSFDMVPSLRHRADEIDIALERLTGEQYRVMDAIEDSPRILCGGGAGTGKTFLAAEIARGQARQGNRVLLTCSSPVLAAFLRSRVSEEGVTIKTVEEIEVSDRVFDILVVDEGQDAINIPSLDRFDKVLRGGLDAGKWRIFHDVNQQAGVSGRFDPEAMEMLRSYGPVPVKLKLNCRNTNQVVLQTKLLTAADLGAPSAGDGPPVEIEHFDSEEEQAALLDAKLRALRDGDVPPGEITILSMAELNDSCAVRSRAFTKGRIVPLGPEDAAKWPVPHTTVARVADFKGMENRFILVVDVPALDRDQRDIAMLYVAMSRARAGLWMALPKPLKERMTMICQGNYPQVMLDASRSAGRSDD